MLYVLGGASRSGKTLLSRRAVTEKQIPYFPLDALVYALNHAAPELRVQYKDSFVDRANNMWPLAKELLKSLAEEERDYLVEGDSLIPSRVSELTAEGISVRSCFVGYTELTKEEKLVLVRDHNQGEVDWTTHIPEEKMLPMIEDMIQFSSYLKAECEKYEIPYFDISHDFDGSRSEAFKYLFV